MDCERVREKFVAYLEGESRLTERLCVQVHTACCYPCKEDLQELRVLLAASSTALRHPNPRNRFDVLMDRIRIAEATTKPARRSMPVRMSGKLAKLAAAAGLLILIGVSPPVFFQSRAWLAHRSETIEPQSSQVHAVSNPFVLWRQGIERETEGVHEPARVAQDELQEADAI